MFQKIKSYLSEGNRTQWCIFASFAFTIFLQCCLFHWLAFESILISSLWKNPMAFWAFYLPKISISAFVACFVFLFRRKSWIVIVSLLINIWIIAELVYFRANRIFLDAHSFTLIDNMNGFWNSVPIYLRWKDLALLFPSVIIAITLLYIKTSPRKYVRLMWVLGFCIFSNVVGCLGVQKHLGNNLSWSTPWHINPFRDRDVTAQLGFTSISYIRNMSVLHAFIYETKKLIQMPFENALYDMSQDEIQQAESFINMENQVIVPTNNLIMILVESLETWAIRPEITPNLCSFIQNHNVIWAKNVTSQTKGGTSSDGQLIFNTGLLPIQSGAVCRRFPAHRYPSLSDIYERAALVQPGDLSIWNQKYMSDAYQIDTNYLSPKSLDHITFSILDSIYTLYPYCMAITMATHSPFVACSNYSSLELPAKMPDLMANYLKCMHYSDSCWGEFLRKANTDSILHNATICFMGDHIIFDSNMRKEFEDYCIEYDLDYDVQNNRTAMVAYSPNLSKTTILEDITYQMDAYPTLLHLIGCEDYYWKGFGINLLDSVARNNRPISEQDAFILSDKIIRANWFESYSK